MNTRNLFKRISDPTHAVDRLFWTLLDAAFFLRASFQIRKKGEGTQTLNSIATFKGLGNLSQAYLLLRVLYFTALGHNDKEKLFLAGLIAPSVVNITNSIPVNLTIESVLSVNSGGAF